MIEKLGYLIRSTDRLLRPQKKSNKTSSSIISVAPSRLQTFLLTLFLLLVVLPLLVTLLLFLLAKPTIASLHRELKR